MTDEIVELTTALLEPVPFDSAVVAQAMQAIADMIDEENRLKMERFLMMQPPPAARKVCDCRGLFHSCSIIT